MGLAMSARERRSNEPINGLWFSRDSEVKYTVFVLQVRIADNNVETLLPVAIHHTSFPMVYDSMVLLEITTCSANDNFHQLSLSSSLLSTQGTFSHVVCDAPCQSPDDKSVIDRSCYPSFVACASKTLLPQSTEDVYVLIHATSGELNSTTGKFEASMRFGAVFSPQ